MDAFERLAGTLDQMRFEAEEGLRFNPREYRARASPGRGREAAVVDRRGRSLPIYHAAGPDGRSFPLLKTMLTTACERNCLYCAFRAGRSGRRATFQPDEMARAFLDLHQAGVVEGLFLSTGIIDGGANTQNRLLATAEILRRRLGFRGYLHLKVMPSAERGQIELAMRLANRVSINLEAPNPGRLARLAPNKDFLAELYPPLRWMEAIRQAAGPAARLASSATQFVIGAAGESDVEILATTAALYRTAGLGRAFYMAFSPCPDTPLEGLPPESPMREHRLYQASYLLRDYPFDLEDLPFGADGRLPLHQDPKSAWADGALRQAPIEVNTASLERLVRVPGIGRRGARAVIAARRHSTMRDLSQLRRLGIIAERTADYITLDGRRPPRQSELFSTPTSPG